MTIDPALWEQPDVRTALAARDIGAVYRTLTSLGINQRQIATLTGQSQSEVSEILKGRQVMAYDVLARIAEGLGLPREYMGLSYGDSATYAEQVTVTDPPEGDDDENAPPRRDPVRAGRAVGPLPVRQGPGATSAGLAGGRLPSRLGMLHVEAVTDLLTKLRALARAWGGQAEVLGAVAVQSKRFLTVPGEDMTRARLGSVLAELHTEAGWTYFDSGDDDAVPELPGAGHRPAVRGPLPDSPHTAPRRDAAAGTGPVR